MTVLSVTEHFRGRQGGDDHKFLRKHTRVFDVVTNATTDNSFHVLSAGSLPTVFSFHPSDTQTVCKSRQAVNDSEDARAWTVTCEYDSDYDPNQTDPNPLNRPARVGWGFDQFQKIAERDQNDKAIVNTVKQLFDPPPEMDDSRPVLKYVRVESSFNVSLATDYQDAVNTDYFLGAPPNTAKVKAITAERIIEKGVVYYEVTYEIQFRREGWTKYILNRGTKYAVVIGGVLSPTDNGKIVNLTSDSKKVVEGSTVGIYYVPYDVYKQRTFATLNITV